MVTLRLNAQTHPVLSSLAFIQAASETSIPCMEQVVYDITEPATFENVTSWLKEIDRLFAGLSNTAGVFFDLF